MLINSTKCRFSLVLGILLASVLAFAAISAEEASADSDSDIYYNSGALMDSLVDANGITDEGTSVAWSKNAVSGYAIAGDFAYVADLAGNLSKIGLRDGVTVKTVQTGAKGTNYPTVGGGYVLDTASGNVYDLDLNLHHSIPDKSVQGYFDDGFWYIVKKDKTCVCYAVDGTAAKWTVKLNFYIDSFTLPVSLAINDGYLFYPGIGESAANKRILYCLDKGTGEQTDMIEMTGINRTYWNSGFIFCEGDTVAVSTHWDTLASKPRLGDYDTIFKIDVGKDGKFKTDTATYISNGYNDTYGSCFVMIDGLAFAQTGLSFKVFDLRTNEIIASTPVDERLGKTYSNMAVAAGDDGFVRGYVSPGGMPLPLLPVDGLIGFEYNKSTKEIRTFDLPVGTPVTDMTNPVKIGPNGEILFAKDDGTLYCLTAPMSGDMDISMVLVCAVIIGVLLLVAAIVIRD